jgi:hypothetical protein
MLLLPQHSVLLLVRMFFLPTFLLVSLLLLLLLLFCSCSLVL